jgi:dipeptide/tripeptide permease
LAAKRSEKNMNDDNSNSKKLDDLEKAAVAVSVSVFVFTVIYWAVQIQSTYDLLSMAYGW